MSAADLMTREEKVKVMEALRAGHARLEQLQAGGSFIEFCNTYMPKHFSKAFGSAQLDLIRTLEKCNNTGARIIRAMPRSHGKTTILTAFTLWNVLYKRKKFIVFISDSRDQSETVLQDVKTELEENERILEDFGNLKSKEKWGAAAILTTTGIRVAAKGAKSSMRGIKNKESRPDLIVIDDLENDKNCETLELRNKLEKWLKNAVLNMPSEFGDVVMIGTILHFDSVMERILKHDQVWDSKKIKAVDEQGRPVWEASWSRERLEKKRKEIGSEAYAQEYMNEPVDEKSKPFKREFYMGYKDDDLTLGTGKRRQFTCFLTFDPAYSGSKRSHWAAQVVVGVDYQNEWWIRDMYRAHASETENVDAFMRLQRTWNCMKTGVETVFNQISFKHAISNAMRRKNQWFQIESLKAQIGQKDARIRALIPRWEAKSIHIPEEHPLYEAFMDELYQYPHGKNDDLLDALAYMIQLTENYIPPNPEDMNSGINELVFVTVDPMTGYRSAQVVDPRKLVGAGSRTGVPWQMV